MAEKVKAATREEIDQGVRPEAAPPSVVMVSGKEVNVRPLTLRWQMLFWKRAISVYEAEIASVERIADYFRDRMLVPDMGSVTGEVVSAELKTIDALAPAAAVILAAQIPGAEKHPEKIIAEQLDWLLEHSTLAEVRALVDAQADKERLVARVGERLPERFAWLLGLDGKVDASSLEEVLQKLRSINSSPKSPGPAGDGNSMPPSAGGSSSATSSEIESPSPSRAVPEHGEVDAIPEAGPEAA